MANVGDHEEIMKTALIIAIGFVLAVASAQDINDLANSYYQFTSDFNFDDILDRFAAKPEAPGAPPARYSLSNIRVQDGDIVFDDQL